MTDDAPRVSVIVPTWNRPRRTVEALESVFAQTFEDFEVLLVDDGSTDDTADTVRARFGQDPRFVFVHKENGGVASARNLGIDRARGAFLALLDSDDLYMPEHLASQVRSLEASPHAAISICDALYEGPWKHEGRTIFSRKSFRPALDLDAVLAGGWGLPSCLMIRRASAPDARFDPEVKLAEDIAFLSAFYARGLTGVVNPDVLTRYRKFGGQMTDDDLALQKARLVIYEAYADRAADPKRMRYSLARRRARILMKEGRWRDARPHLWRWLRSRPGTRPLGYFLKSLFRG